MKKVLSSTAILLSLVACNGGGGNGGGSNVGGGYTHNQLAVKFVQELNLDAEFDVELVKQSTLQDDYIVIYDPLYDSYDAINIESYDPGYDNAADYYFDYSASSYYDLDIIPGHYELEYDYGIVGYDEYGYAVYGYDYFEVWIPTRYQDYYTGITFEKTAATPKDLAKVAALKEVAEINKTAEFLSSQFGLSLDRGKDVAKLAQNWKKASKKGMTDSELDAFSTELLGFSISAGKVAAESALEGDSASLESLVNQAAETNGITPEHASKLMTKMFGL